MFADKEADGLGPPFVIGQGTYGCVHKPQMKCKNKTRKNSNKVSKLMTKVDANDEMREYKMIANADKKKEVYMGKPTKCNIENISLNRNAAKRCHNKNLPASELDKQALLIMKFGGKNLEQFADHVFETWEINARNTSKIELFWLEISRIFYGLKVFHDNKIIHHDLKHQNIVYNEKTNRVNFIDFGFMTNKDDIIKNARNSTYHLSYKYHWSFPWEIVFLNKDTFQRHITRVETNTVEHYNDYADEIEDNCGYFFHSILPISKKSEQRPTIQHLLGQYYTMLLELDDAGYDRFLHKSVDTIDSYGIGMALLYTLNRTGKFLDDDLFKNLSILFINMVSPNIYIRSNVDQLLQQYRSIMMRSGLLEKHNRRYDNYLLAKGSSLPKKIAKRITDMANDRDFIIDAATLSDDILEIKPFCPTGKEYKRLTKRCVNICKEGFVRDQNFKCIRDKTQKRRSPCPRGKDRNPISNRCVQKCKPGFLRDKTYKCRKGFNPFM